MTAAIVTTGLEKLYGSGNGLNGFTLSVPTGSITGLVGRNGAGKTTWMMAVVGFVRPHAGSVNILGRGPFDAAKHSGRISILPQDSELPLEAAPFDLLVRYGRLQGMSPRNARNDARKLLEAFNLVECSKRPVKALSHGMRKRLMVAQAFVGSPEVVLLDEPMSGLDPIEIKRMRDFLISRRGRQTIVISSHILDDIEKLCTHVAFVEAGRVVRMSTLANITAQARSVNYRLANPPDISALQALAPQMEFSWNAAARELAVQYASDTSASVVEVNSLLLPALFKFGVEAVHPGCSLEQAYVGKE